MERHVSDIITDHVCKNFPISDHQWGFMHHRSSTSALIAVLHDWLKALDDGYEICIVFFDVQKAFDSVPQIPLLEKTGINPHILKWVENYLTNRKQFVAVKGSCSPALQVLSGVPTSMLCITSPEAA